MAAKWCVKLTDSELKLLVSNSDISDFERDLELEDFELDHNTIGSLENNIVVCSLDGAT